MILRSDSAVETQTPQTTDIIDQLPFAQFVWGSGIECSFLPHLNVDQFHWTQHNRFWREDFKRLKDVGISNLRYAFPWHILQPQRGEFDWSFADERIEELDKLGINLFLDVMHFGTPLWLKQAVGDPEFPEALEEFTEAMVSRYRQSVKVWCPFNEPLVSALFSGDFGFWPPHSRKWRGYMPVLSRIVQATNRGIRAIRRAMPEATVLLCDAAENFKTRSKDPEIQLEVKRRNLRRFVVMDLLTGRVDRHHPLFDWLSSYGMSDVDLDWFKSNPQSPDVLGLDYYPHSDWQLESEGGTTVQRRADNPVGLYGVANAYYQRYGTPLMLTETSIEGQSINREIWLDTTLDHISRLREQGIPFLGLFWWPLIDQVDWDGALTHRIGKIHRVGLFNLKRSADGALLREPSPLIDQFKSAVEADEERIGKLSRIVQPSGIDEEQLPPVGQWNTPTVAQALPLNEMPGGNGHSANGNGHSNGNGSASKRLCDPVPGAAGEPAAAPSRIIQAASGSEIDVSDDKFVDRYGIVVFSHLRWGFVWQRPQQFLSRFAKKHPVLFFEEPFFDRPEGSEPDVSYHRVMPNVTVATPHMAASWGTNPEMPHMLRKFARAAIERMNEDGSFDRPLLWYYSPMDSSWSLGHIENRGIVYDSMDELSQFSGAPRSLMANEQRLMDHSDIVFTGGYELWTKKKQRHGNAHFFGCGVEYSHFSKAQDSGTSIPPDIDFMKRPILGWFGVVDERVDYALLAEMARMRQHWSFAIVGPVVKMDPNLLPHAPNLFWLGQRDYQVLPNYCRAFDVNMMAFAINAATEFINPTKALEYLATGKPVISTPVKDVVRQYSDLVEIARTPEEFIKAAERALENPDQDRIQRGIEKAKASSWEATVATMQRLIREAITPKDRRSARKIAPLAPEEAQLAYVYQATQGS